MHRFPSIQTGDQIWRLPLPEHLAAELAELLLTGKESRRGPLQELLVANPLLAVWAICCSRYWWERPPVSLPQLAEWLSVSLAGQLAVESQPLKADLSGSRDEPPEIWRLSDLAKRISVDASRICNERGGARSSADLAALLGLLSVGRELLCQCGDTFDWERAVAGRTCFPPGVALWLEEVERLREPANRTAETPLDVEPGVAEALAAVAGANQELSGRKVPAANAPGRTCESSWAGLLPALAERLRRLEALEDDFTACLEREKVASLKSLAYGASHELNNPLANIATRAQNLLREEPDPERRRKLATINSQAFRAHEMISDMMLFAQPPKLDRHPFDLGELAQTALGELAGEAESQGTALSCRTIGDRSLAQVDQTQLTVAIKAVCLNALEALRGGGAVEVRVERYADETRRWHSIAVIDSGPGIPPEVRRHLFDPYFSGREAGRGLGLGLSKCWSIIREHGGRIVVEEVAPQGALIRMLLPVEGEELNDAG